MAMLLFTFPTTPNNLVERADGTRLSTRNPIHGEGNYYKRGEKEIERRAKNPYQTRGTRKGSSDRAKDQPSLINPVHLSLIVKSTVLTVVHTLKPSYLTHSLQIHCTELTGHRSHTFCAWTEKRDPTIGTVCGKSLCVSKCNS